jgi:transmembrane sensor
MESFAMSPDASIRQAAAEWLALQEQGLSPAQSVELARWLAADKRHEKNFRALQEAWTHLDRLRGSHVGARLEAELSELPGARCSRVQELASRRVRWVSGAVAASLVWGVVYFAWWRPQQAGGPYAEIAATEIGVVRTLKLPDGSKVSLNTNTAVEVRFTTAERRIHLSRGEALFTVAKNPARPFVVNVAGTDVSAVGTEFNVRLRSEEVEVIVNEGLVRIADAVNGESLLGQPESLPVPPLLSAGNRVVIPVTSTQKPAVKSAAPMAIDFVEIKRSLAWRDRRLVFESAPLHTIVEEFNRYNRRQLVIADATLADRRFGGTFEATDTHTFVELLRSNYDVSVEERADAVVLYRRK